MQTKLSSHDIENIITLIVESGDIAMQYYKQEYTIDSKKDNSPVTTADLEVNSYIINKLYKLFPHIPIISEENKEEDNIKASKSDIFWLIDPIDGTKSFINHEDSFTVNIGLVENKNPIYGFIYCPVAQTLYYTDYDNNAYKQIRDDKQHKIHIHSKPHDSEGLKILISSRKSHQTREYIEQLQEKIKETKILPSSIKLCLIAEGTADLHPKFGTTMEWDTAAGHAILNAAGGAIEDMEGFDLTYNKLNFINPYFIARGKYYSF
jgi:3'(2'), 5'-bisphosphate nucleotidase